MDFEDYINKGYVATEDWKAWTDYQARHKVRNKNLGKLVADEMQTVYEGGFFPKLFESLRKKELFSEKEMKGWLPNGKANQIQYMNNYSQNGNGIYCLTLIECTRLSPGYYCALGVVEKERDSNIFIIEWDNITDSSQIKHKKDRRISVLRSLIPVRQRLSSTYVVDIPREGRLLDDMMFKPEQLAKIEKDNFILDFKYTGGLYLVEIANVIAESLQKEGKNYTLVNIGMHAKKVLSKVWPDANIEDKLISIV